MADFDIDRDETYSSKEFLYEVPGKLRCALCKHAAKEPWQHGKCEQIFCRSCITRNKDNVDICPYCKEEKAEFYTDLRSNREIQSLIIRCEHHKKGCHWEGQLSALRQHLRSKCQFALVPCPRNCKTMVPRGKQPQHMRDECSLRKYKCPHCGEQGIYHNKTTKHLEVCPMLPTPCPNSRCDIIVTANKLQEHVDLDCEYSFLNCKFEPLGCSVALLRKQLKAHEHDANFHLDIIIQAYVEHTKKLEYAERERQDQILKMQQLESNITRPLHSMEQTRKNTLTTVTVKIKNFSNYKQCQTASSAIVYSDEGHKLRMQITPNNIRHVSVTFTVMKSEEDNNLPWPYGGKIRIELLNQLEDRYHYYKIVDYPKVYGSRVSGRSMSLISYGALEFISHHDLQNAVYRGGPDEEIGNRPNVCYLLDDVAYFRVSTKPLWLQCTY